MAAAITAVVAAIITTTAAVRHRHRAFTPRAGYVVARGCARHATEGVANGATRDTTPAVTVRAGLTVRHAMETRSALTVMARGVNDIGQLLVD